MCNTSTNLLLEIVVHPVRVCKTDLPRRQCLRVNKSRARVNVVRTRGGRGTAST